MKEFFKMINDVEILYKVYQGYISNQDRFDRNTIGNFAKTNIGDKLESLKMISIRIPQKLNGPSDKRLASFGNVGLLQLVAEDMQVFKYTNIVN